MYGGEFISPIKLNFFNYILIKIKKWDHTSSLGRYLYIIYPKKKKKKSGFSLFQFNI